MTELRSLLEIEVATMPTVGRIVRITNENVAVVDYPDSIGGPFEARIAVDPPTCCSNLWPPVLLVFEDGNPELPIIIGFVRREFKILDGVKEKDSVSPSILPTSRGQRMFAFDAEEVVLSCGKSSILLRRDGKIVIQGCQILSRASGTNKIQGGAVRLN